MIIDNDINGDIVPEGFFQAVNILCRKGKIADAGLRDKGNVYRVVFECRAGLSVFEQVFDVPEDEFGYHFPRCHS
ncbi:hypothetical protein [Oxalobacter paraformigenes]|nr:hypothetical protein [Oxalobacter paraformigenes]